MAEYITKDQVIEWFRPYGHTEEGISFDVLKTDIADMSAADVAPVVHGRWKQDYFFDEPVTRCSACGVGFAKGHKAERFPYCPHCGAKMDGGGADD